MSNDILPEKSKGRYMTTYENFITWQKEKNITSFNEKVLLLYFEEISSKYKPTSLWAIYSMLKSGLKRSHRVNIEEYYQLGAYLKKLSKGYVSKKMKVLSIQNVEKFINEAPDDRYLAIKVALILGINGGLRCKELSNLQTNHIENHGEVFVIKIPESKEFVIKGKYYKIMKKYQDLRIASASTNRFFQAYRNGKCRANVIGKNRFGIMPKEIAEFLKLPDPKSYTGHTLCTVSRVPDDRASVKAERRMGDTPINDSISRKRPRPEPPAPRDQCRFCGDFKKCSPVVQKPYLMGKTTTLTLNHLRAEVDFSVDSLPTTICSDCDTKLLEIFQFIKLVNTAQFSLVTVCPNNATGAASLDQNHSVFEHIEFDTQIVKTEVESDDSNESIGEDSITLSEMIYLRDTHKRKEVDSKHNKKVKRDKVKIQDTDEIDDVKSAVIDDYDGNSEDSELTQEDNSEDSDTGTEVKTCEFNFANIASDYDRKTNFCDVNNQNSSGEDSD
ncbi:uncharacterized protein LOC125238594 isoform X2 [Leguminivora glycinivorella]|uniref:uncharacterized protein LOC125238594 isoform X2 n=1 Tax=Leguminivora glycinivorella TaxID=1035111 RepID=UPI00200F1ECB|nr:uncharacterized protein LOC125238594 isoform X2 [Leguminivora glycinivorella]